MKLSTSIVAAAGRLDGLRQCIIMESRGAVGPRTREAFLAYYRKTRRLARTRRGLYADEKLRERIRSQPMLLWKANKVRRHRGPS